MFKFKKLLSYQYLFEVNPVLLTRSDKFFAAIGVVCVILAIVFKISAIYSPSPIDKNMRERFFNLFLTIGILEVIWFGARYQNIRFFGSHFIALLILVIGLVWLVNLILKIVKNYSIEKSAWEKDQVKNKYLPQ